MRKRRLFWQLFPICFTLALSAKVIQALQQGATDQSLAAELTLDQLKSNASNVFPELDERLLTDGGQHTIKAIIQRFNREAKIQFGLWLPDGTNLVQPESQLLQGHPLDLDLREAGTGRIGIHIKGTAPRIMHYSLPIIKNGRVTAILRTSTPIPRTTSLFNPWSLMEMLFIATALALVFTFWASSTLTRQIRALKDGARRLADGDFHSRFAGNRIIELNELSDAMNQMAHALDMRVRDSLKLLKEEEAILASMSDIVIAVDLDLRIINLNKAANIFFGVPPDEIKYKKLNEILRWQNLLSFIQATAKALEPLEREMVWHGLEVRIFQAKGTPLRDASGSRFGALVVLADVTKVRKLENMRREFVANVSHELKTPLTGIKGFVETLIDGAIHDHEDALRFLKIIEKQIDRLHAIIQDLLALSRIEQSAQSKDALILEHCQVLALIKGAVEVCNAPQKNAMELYIHCPPELSAQLQPSLIEQALVNLIDNAVKYSEPGSKIEIRAVFKDGNLVIEVQDQGGGIAAQHLPRLFERFYRVDKARSRKVGGTGLGLSIVKHITQAHGGRVSVSSRLGEGATFVLTLPQKPSQS